MGNIRSKNNLNTILKKWERFEGGDNDCKTFSYKINGVTIHKVDGEFFVENQNTVIGPMSQEQLIMLSKKNSDFQLRPNFCNQPMPDGDRSINEILSENLVSTKQNKQNAHISKIPTKKNIVPDMCAKNKIIKTDDDHSKSSDKLSESNISELKTDELSLNITNTNIYNTEAEVKSAGYQKKIKPILKQKNSIGEYFKTNPSNVIKFQHQSTTENKKIDKNPTYYKNVNFLKKPCDDTKINGRFPGRKTMKTTVKELNLSFSKKKNLKRQFNLSIINKYKEDLKIQELKNDVEMRMGDHLCDSIQLNCSMKSHIDSQKIQSIGFTEPINKEKYRYTAFVKAENLNWPKQKSLVRRLKFAFEEKFGCTVQLGDEFIEYRGNVIYTVNIEGKDKLAVLKCRNSLPFELRTNLILSKNNSEEVNGALNEKWKSTIPYNPRIIINELGSKTVKLSY